MISYQRLWKTMRKKGITQYALINKYHVSPGQITRLKRNESVSTHTIEMFCRILECRVEKQGTVLCIDKKAKNDL